MYILGDGAGPVSRAVAQSTTECPGPGPTVLFDAAATATPVEGRCLGPEIDISAFRQVVVHKDSSVRVEFKLGNAAGFVLPTNPFQDQPVIQVIDPLLARVIRLSWAVNNGSCGQRGLTVVGYGDPARIVVPPPEPSATATDRETR